jgi:DNA-directed RNA polymerase subunit beta'
MEKECLALTENWVVPEPFKEPEWVKELEQKIITEVKQSNFDNEKFKKLLEKDLLKGKIKPKYPLTKKTIPKLVEEMWEKFDSDEFIYRYYLLGRLGFYLSTYKPANFSPESLQLPEKFKKRKEELLKEYENKIKSGVPQDKAVAWIDKEFNKLTKEVIEYWDKNGIDLADIIKSGSRGKPDDIRKMLVAIGLSINSKGEVNDIILRSHIEGLEQTQMFHYSSQAIQALYAKSSETAVPGYLARKLSTVLEPLVLSKVKDCGSKRYLEIEIQDEDMLEAIDGRVMYNGKIINTDKDKDLIGKKVKLRSPLYCKAQDGICETCLNPVYVKKLQLKPGDKIGLIVATSIGADALVNLTLKKSHVGISLDLEEVNLEEDIFKYAE